MRWNNCLPALLLLSACVSPPEYDIVPSIEFVSMSRTQVGQLDSIRIEIGFTDGDGDLGFQTLDSSNCNFCNDSCLTSSIFSLFIYDDRKGNCVTPYNVPYIPPKGSSEAISGTLDILISSICCIYPDGFSCTPSSQYPKDTVNFSVQIKDRAGHLSNKIALPPVFISCN